MLDEGIEQDEHAQRRTDAELARVVQRWPPVEPVGRLILRSAELGVGSGVHPQGVEPIKAGRGRARRFGQSLQCRREDRQSVART